MKNSRVTGQGSMGCIQDGISRAGENGKAGKGQ